MSANILDGIKPQLNNGAAEDGGAWHNAGRTIADGHDDWLVWDLAGQSALATNQTYHVGLSTRGASANSASLHATIGYKDAAGNVNWVNSGPLPIGTSWGRAESTIVVPSGMTPFAFYVAAYGVCPETWMAAPTLSLGSPVTLASSAHTPYATQDHVAAEYATKASLSVTDESIEAEVAARTKTDKAVSDLSAKVTQTSDSLSTEVSDRKQAITTVTWLANAASSSAASAVDTANSASSTASAASTAASKASSDAAAALAETKDLVTLRIDSSRGTVFKNSEISTVLSVRCYKRGQEITTLGSLRQAMSDSTARIRWYVLREGDADWVSLADSDHMISNDGFTLTVTPNDVSVKCTFKAEIVTD